MRKIDLHITDVLKDTPVSEKGPKARDMNLTTLMDYSMINPNEKGGLFTDWIGYWRPGEWLWYGHLEKHFFKFDPLNEILGDIKGYFGVQSYNWDLEDDYEWDRADRYDSDLENLIKLVWLTNEYVSADFKFQNPVGGHWCPHNEQIIIHPGGCRNKIINLFGEKVEVIFFNTGGFRTIWLGFLDPVDPFDLIEDGWRGSVVPDHGSLIPHLLKDLQSIKDGKAEWHLKLKDKLSNNKLKVYSNIELPYLENWSTTKDEANVTVTFTKKVTELSDENYIQAILCTLAEVDYTNEYLTVKHG